MRPQTSAPLTLEEHRELGAEMRRMNSRLQELCKLVVSVYGPNCPAAFTFTKTAGNLDKLCLDLQAQVGRDYPGYSTDGFYV